VGLRWRAEAVFLPAWWRAAEGAVPARGALVNGARVPERERKEKRRRREGKKKKREGKRKRKKEGEKEKKKEKKREGKIGKKIFGKNPENC
jgi:hypothetical protein